VRAARARIQERGIIQVPDLVVVADDTLVPVPAAGVLAGIGADTVLLLNTPVSENEWRERLNFSGPLVVLPTGAEVATRADLPYVGAACVGAAARLLGVIPRQALQQGIRDEIAPLGEHKLRRNLDTALGAFDALAERAGLVTEGAAVAAEDYVPPEWVALPAEPADVAAPVIHAAATSVLVKTGLWRTQRPVIDYDRCKGCWWVCSSYCPDGAIAVEDGLPVIDYDHCKGCMVCVAQCPSHAIEAVPERLAQQREAAAQEGRQP
jgi:pyruvate ferredoxin oxidoreductase gamma subunit